jgi:galactose oxidase
MDNPNVLLENAIKNQNIVNYIKFDVSTKPTKDFSGGGTANIAFLGGPGATMEEAGSPANAFAASVKATFWLETVKCKFSAPANSPTEFAFRPAGDFGPTFTVPPTLGYSKDIDYTVSYLQLQYSQTVLLDFLRLNWPHVSVATLGEQTTFNLALPPIPPPPQPKGKWGPVFPLSNVAAHASLLPTGKVLYWGRRSDPSSLTPDSMKEHHTDAYILDPVTYKSKRTASDPTLTSNRSVNLFCSGHCFQPDGSLFVVGGHLQDGHGVNQACVYDAFEDTWSPQPRMNYGRWYPSALTMNDGSSIAISGTYYDDTDDSTPMNDIPQIWRNDEWITMPRMNDDIPPSYPRLHLDPRGEVFMAGPMLQSQFLDETFDNGIGAWTIDGPQLDQVPREYGPSVMYDSGKIMYIGGGGGNDNDVPTNVTNFINLCPTDDSKPKWTLPEDSPQMKFRRRHHNGTILPDGTVLVTGGTSGPGFNNVEPGNTVHVAELMDPSAKTPQWIEMEPESVDRCYHSIALLLPDGQVLSAGGGEWSPGNTGNPNDPKDSHQDAQLFMPPYLFKGDRPTVSSAPADVDYGQSFEVSVDSCDSIAKVSWIRLGSATHACNMSQSFTFLKFEQRGTKVTIYTPANSNIAPPGYYMLFLLNHEGVPSIASMVCIARHGTTPPKSVETAGTHPYRKARPIDYSLSLSARNEKIMAEQNRPAVAIGLTASCPYGLGPCWSAAHRGLRNIKDIEKILPVPDSTNSIAFVYLKQDIIPDIDVWCEQFEKAAGKQYHIRGLEMTVFGQVARHHSGTDEQIIVRGTSIRHDLVLAPFSPHSKLEWDRAEREPKAALDKELHAWALLSTTLEGPKHMRVTGRLQKLGHEKYSLEVRSFKETGNGGTPNGV